MLKRMLLDVRKTQREVANDLGLEYYTMISQMEAGKARVPPDQMRDYAKSLRVPVKDFTKQLMQYYDPITFELLFGRGK